MTALDAATHAAVDVEVGSRARTTQSMRPHGPVLAGQAIAGAGNLVFAVGAAKILGAGDYADVVSFLALYLLLHVPASALSAAGSLAPDRIASAHRTVLRVGLVVGACVAALSGPISHTLGLPIGLVLALAVAAPGAGLLGLERGLAYGHLRQRPLIRSLMTEPAVRITVGIVLTATIGPVGAAIGTVLAGYGALWVCSEGFAARAIAPPGPRALVVDRRAPVVVAVSFVMVAVIQSVDLIIANRVLDSHAAAQFAVLSTLGGAAVFATATIPMVLMPVLTGGGERAASGAIWLTVAVGLVIAAIGTLLAGPLGARLFDAAIAPSAGLVGFYLFAMASLGVARVLVAHRCATGDGRFAMTVVGVALVLDIAALLTFASSVRSVATITLLTSTAMATVLSFAPVRVLSPPRRLRVWVPWRYRTGALAMFALCLIAADLRLATNRGLWVDEAISVRQAQLPFGQMLADMRNTDVHPPLHHTLLWITVRIFGTSELAVRLPSLIAGVALVPAMAWTGRVIYDRRTGWVAAGLAAVAPFCVWYSQEARMYALFMLFAALATGAQVVAIRRGLRRDWLIYAVCTAALIWTQYFAFLPVLVQQVGFAWVVWRDRAPQDPVARDRRRALVRGWLMATVLIAVTLIPLLPILHGQFAAYTNRSDGLVPGQAGANSSTIGGAISIYAVGANLIWGIWGYHADGVMVQIAALWPLVMLLGLLLLGRGRSGPSVLLLGLVVVPMAMLFVIGSIKRDLFELRYFSGAVPAMLLLGARLVTSTTRRRVAGITAAGVLTATMAAGLVDQQLNGANPRLYDFRGALAKVHEIDTNTTGGTGRPIVLYEPAYLADVIA
ncbi:MAG: hypothetical protein JWN62_1184, partial [Acidimicrobiales bacterium]|nr:hypothetical protein [Acidimicrobiales bacterium]